MPNSDSSNIIMSPLSMNLALLILANGTNGKAREEIEDYLGGTTKDLNDKYAHLFESQSLSQELKIANSIWCLDSLLIKKDYEDKMKKLFLADIYKTSNLGPVAANLINSWVREKTDDMIDGIVDQFADGGKMVLVNAMYFENEWETKFDIFETTREAFYTKDGKIFVDMMNGEVDSYMETNDFVGFQKDYKNHKYSFLAMLPKKDNSKFEDLYTGEFLSSEQHTKTRISMPKFDFGYQTDLSFALCHMGINKIFDKGDFTPMLGIGNHSIDSVFHKSRIVVNEERTIAASITANLLITGTIEREEAKKEISLNRPFYFMILNKATNVPVFIGYLENPNCN